MEAQNEQKFSYLLFGCWSHEAESAAACRGDRSGEIEPVKKYTKADLLWMNPLSRSFREVATRKSKRPEIVDKELDLTGYDKIFLGFPIWGWAAPSIVNAFLEKHDFSGKTIVVFATSGGTMKLDGSVKSLKPSVSETAVLKEGKVLNGEWTKEALAEWADNAC